LYIANGAVPVKPASVRASIDTIELFCRIPPRGLRTRIEAVVGRRIKIEDIVIRGDRRVGCRSIINHPTLDQLPVLHDELLKGDGGCIHRVDVAYDFGFRTEDDADQFRDYLDQHGIQKWRPRKAVKKYVAEESIYWSEALVVYSKPNNTVRLELRFSNAGKVRKALRFHHSEEKWSDDFEKLEHLDPRRLLQHRFKLVQLKSGYVKKAVRRAVKKDCEQHRKKATRGSKFLETFQDRYRAGIPARVEQIFNRVDLQHFVTGKKRADKVVERLELDWLQVPNRLDWSGRGREISRAGRRKQRSSWRGVGALIGKRFSEKEGVR
jgi:hypothetical protein